MPIQVPRILSKKELAELVPLIDEYGDIRARIAAAQVDVNRAEALRAQFLDYAGEFDYKKNRVLQGSRFTVDIGPRTFVNRIDTGALFAKLGMLKFLKIASVTKKALESVLSGNEAAKYMDAAQTGPRIVKAIPVSDS